MSQTGTLSDSVSMDISSGSSPSGSPPAKRPRLMDDNMAPDGQNEQQDATWNGVDLSTSALFDEEQAAFDNNPLPSRRRFFSSNFPYSEILVRDGGLTSPVLSGGRESPGLFDSMRLPSISLTESMNYEGPSLREAEPSPFEYPLGSSVTYLGPSADVEPVVLRCKPFTAETTWGYRPMQPSPTGHNNQGNIVATQHKSPVYFKVNPQVFNGEQELSRLELEAADHEIRMQLNRMIHPETGIRVISLFFRRVFPSLPIVTRSHFGITGDRLQPQAAALAVTPPYLLAAMYETALPFYHTDPIAGTFYDSANSSTRDALKSLVVKSIFRQPQANKLALLQTVLLHMHASPESTDLEESSFRGSLLGVAVNLCNVLGLNRDCVSWPIPFWEKRLRRRLGWAVYSEAVWRSLLCGHPCPIAPDQWELGPLHIDDFLIDTFTCPSETGTPEAISFEQACCFTHIGADYKYFVTLSVIGYDVYASFYTLVSTKQCAANFDLSYQIAVSLLVRLEQWAMHLPSYLRLDKKCEYEFLPGVFHSWTGGCLRLAFFTMKVMIYRAVFRSMKGSKIGGAPASTTFAETIGPAGRIPTSQDRMTETRDAVKFLFPRILKFGQTLNLHEANTLWFSWSGMAFVTLSNFAILQLVESRNVEEAKEAVTMIKQWLDALRDKSTGIEHMQMALSRLEHVLLTGIENVFVTEEHVRKVLRNDVE